MLTAIALGLSCFNPFAPELETSQDSSLIITEQQSPDETLQNFKLAYFFRDSVLYSEVLDSAFIFYFFDPAADAANQFVSWGLDTDLKTTGRLFRSFDVINLIWESTVFEDTLINQATADPLRIEQVKRFSLKLLQTSSGLEYNLWGKATFTFMQNPHDQRWRIERWQDESSY